VSTNPTYATATAPVSEPAERRILVVDQRQARLIEIDASGVRERHDEHFPRTAPVEDRDRRGHQHQAELSHRRRRHLDGFLRGVAAEADAISRDGVPLVVAAAEPVLGRVRRLLDTPLAGVIRGHHLRTPVSRISELARIDERIQELRAASPDTPRTDAPRTGAVSEAAPIVEVAR
jgi:hypothetical protein